MSSMNFPSSPSDGDPYHKWVYDSDTSSWALSGTSGSPGGGAISVSYGSSPPVTSGSTEGEEFFVTSNGTSSGVVSAGYIWNGSSWTEQLTTVDGSLSGSDF